jgi:LysR family transcriptional activator of nhaA
MSQSFNYKHLFYFWVVAKEGGLARASERLNISLPTISAQVRTLEKDLGCTLLKPQGRNLVLTEAGVAAMREADMIFALGENLPHRVREMTSGKALRFNVGISDGIAKIAVHRLLANVLGEPHLKLLCHEGEFEQLLGELAMHKLDVVLSDRPVTQQTGLRLMSHLLDRSPLAWYAHAKWTQQPAANFPQCLSEIPMLLPTHHSATRVRIDHWFERERIKPRLVGEFEDSALLVAFGSAGMGIFPAPESLGDEFKAKYGLEKVAAFPEVEEQWHLIHAARKVLHPLLALLLAPPNSPSSKLV